MSAESYIKENHPDKANILEVYHAYDAGWDDATKKRDFFPFLLGFVGGIVLGIIIAIKLIPH